MLKGDLFKLVIEAKKKESHVICIDNKVVTGQGKVVLSNSDPLMHLSLGLTFFVLAQGKTSKLHIRTSNVDSICHVQASEKRGWARVCEIVLIFYCYFNKLPQIQMLKITQIYYLIFCVDRSPGTVQLSWFPAQNLTGQSQGVGTTGFPSSGSGKNPLPNSFTLLAEVHSNSCGTEAPFFLPNVNQGVIVSFWWQPAVLGLWAAFRFQSQNSGSDPPHASSLPELSFCLASPLLQLRWTLCLRLLLVRTQLHQAHMDNPEQSPSSNFSTWISV